jgi:hypothetical protein
MMVHVGLLPHRDGALWLNSFVFLVEKYVSAGLKDLTISGTHLALL